MNVQKKDYVKKIREQLKEWEDKMADLERKTHRLSGEERKKYEKELENVKMKHQAFEKKLTELEIATGDAWKSMKWGVEKTVDDYKNTIHGLSAQYPM